MHSKKEFAILTVKDLVSELTYYGRKEDEDLSESDLEELIKSGELTIDEIVSYFKKSLIEFYEKD